MRGEKAKSEGRKRQWLEKREDCIKKRGGSRQGNLGRS